MKKISEIIIKSSDLLRSGLFLFLVFFAPPFFSGSGKVPTFCVQTVILGAFFLCMTELCFFKIKPPFMSYRGIRAPLILFLLFIVYVSIQWVGGLYVFSKCIPGSIARCWTMDFLVQLICYIMFFFLSLDFFSTRKRFRVFTFVLAVTVIFIMVLGYYYQKHSQPQPFTKMYGIYDLAPDYRAFYYSSFFHKNQYSGYLVLASLFLLASVLYCLEVYDEKRRINFYLISNLFYLVLLPFLVFSMFDANTRAAFAVGLFCLMVFGVAAVSSRFRAKVLFLVSTIILSSLLYILFTRANIIDRFIHVTTTWSARVFGWRDLSGIFFDYPLFGTGLGTTTFISSLYQVTDAGIHRYIYMINYNLQLLAETGLVGYILFMLPLFLIGVGSTIKCLRSDSRWSHIYGLASFTAMVATLVFCTGDDYLRAPAFTLLFIVSLAIIVRCANLDIQEDDETPGASSIKPAVSLKRAGLWIFLVVFLFSLFLYANRRRLEFETMRLANGNSKILEQSVILRPEDALAWDRLGDAYFKEAIRNQSANYRKSIQSSIKACEKAVKLAPTWHRGWLLLGRARIASGDKTQGFKDIIHGVQLAPYNRNDYIYLIVSYLRAAESAPGEEERKELKRNALVWLDKTAGLSNPIKAGDCDYICNQRIRMPGWCPQLGKRDRQRIEDLIKEAHPNAY